MSNESQTKLTSEQEALIPSFRARWSKIGLNCEPANRPEAEKDFVLAYGSIEAAPPRYTVWCGSPLMGSFMCGIFADPERGAYTWINQFGDLSELVGKDWGEIESEVWETVDDMGALLPGSEITVTNAWRSLWMQLVIKAGTRHAASTRELATENKDLTYTVEMIIGAFEAQGLIFSISVAEKIGQMMFDACCKDRIAEIESNGRQKAWDACYGSHDASWLGFYEFFRDVVKYEKCNELNGLIGAAQHSGWFWPFESLCIASERHNFISLDDNERLHNTKRAAVEYPDGFKIFSCTGVQVPQWLIEDRKSLTVDHILRERNAEVRRIMLSEEFMPRERFMRETGAKLVSEDEFGKLYRATMKTGDGQDFTISGVEVVDGTVKPDGTRRTYWLGALNTHQTARESVAWSYGVETGDYHPTVRK